MGLAIGKLPSAWNKFTMPVAAEDSTQRALVFGGYRWANDIAVEAAFNASDKYALRPGVDRSQQRRAGAVGPDSHLERGRVYELGIRSQPVAVRPLGLCAVRYASLDCAARRCPGDTRRLRDGVNYGVGLRYDLTQALGLRVEYSRFNRYSGDPTNVGIIPESDAVTLGVQFKF